MSHLPQDGLQTPATLSQTFEAERLPTRQHLTKTSPCKWIWNSKVRVNMGKPIFLCSGVNAPSLWSSPMTPPAWQQARKHRGHHQSRRESSDWDGKRSLQELWLQFQEMKKRTHWGEEEKGPRHTFFLYPALVFHWDARIKLLTCPQIYKSRLRSRNEPIISIEPLFFMLVGVMWWYEGCVQSGTGIHTDLGSIPTNTAPSPNGNLEGLRTPVGRELEGGAREKHSSEGPGISLSHEFCQQTGVGAGRCSQIGNWAEVYSRH